MTRLKPILIIEGVTGAGKTSIISHLRHILPSQTRVIPEEETLGNVMSLVNDERWAAHPTFEHFERILAGFRQLQGPHPIVLERFHLTAYALLPNWEVLRSFDTILAELDAHLVLCTFPNNLIENRSIDRADDPGYADTMIGYYGSRNAAIEAVRVSQERRVQALSMTRLPFLHLDTSDNAWTDYAKSIRMFIE